jgi:hypothetical protein
MPEEIPNFKQVLHLLESEFCFLDLIHKLFQNPCFSLSCTLRNKHCSLRIFLFLHHSLFLCLLFYFSQTFSNPHILLNTEMIKLCGKTSHAQIKNPPMKAGLE